MKKQLLILVMMLLPMVASADAVEIDGIYYNLITKGKAAEVTSNPNKYRGSIVIPEIVIYEGENYSVTSIGSGAFYSSGIYNITIPNSITSIGEKAFYGCSGLTSVSIPNSVTSIGNSAFWGCKGLTSISISNGVTSIGYGTFHSCTSLSSFTIPYGVKTIGEIAFSGCSGLTSITIPQSLTDLGAAAFKDCSGLIAVHISDLETWYKITFASDNANPLIYAHHLYLNDEEIKDLVITNNITNIKEYTFSGCSGLTSISIPNSVTSIGADAFKECSALTSITFPNSVTSIGACAFAKCSGLISVDIPNSVTIIGLGAFSGCSSLTSITIPNSVTIIDSYTFQLCSSLTSISIPNSVTSIREYAFNHCPNLADVICYAENVPNTGYGIFNNSYIEYATLHVPLASVNAYKAVEPWKNFKSIVNIAMHTLTYMIEGEIYKSYQVEEGAIINIEADPVKEGFSFSGWSEIPKTMPAHDVTVTGTFSINSYKLTYKVDDEEYKSTDIEYGSAITPETAPTKEGYTFSGWSEIPETMPAHDVTVTGTFSINSYKLTYTVDGVEYKSTDVEYGTAITPETAQTKEGYTFSGWSEIPETMPAHDVTITGTFSINSYKLTYQVDDEEYKTYDVEFGASITPETEPTKEGYAFSGWSTIPETMPAHDVIVTGSFSKGQYKLIYIVDEQTYKTISYDYDDTIIPEPAPQKDGYSFSGWSEIPETMPAHNVTVTGTFTVNKYKLIYEVAGEVYKTYDVEFGATIAPEAEPTKEGYTFSGWGEIPETMPAHDVTITGSFSINSYKLTYKVDGEAYKSYNMKYGATIAPEAEPTKEGYTFSGWSEIPETMPACDVTISGSFTVNKYKITYIIDGEIFATEYVDYGATIVPPTVEEREEFIFSGWEEVPETMPSHDITIYGSFTTSIANIKMNANEYSIYNLSGSKIHKLQHGVNIVIDNKGNIKKIRMK